MFLLPKTGLVAGTLIGACLLIAPQAHAKCTPATERLLPRPVGKEFISVFITCETRMDALQAFANTSTKHPNVLGSTKVDVDEVNLGAKGIYYRALIGEPGPKAAATATCNALKAVGYRWCRAMQY